MTTIHNILKELRDTATSKRDLGSKFERLIKKLLLTAPEYSNLSDVWLWSEWPYRGSKTDTGIDLVAIERGTGEYWAIQCKFYEPDHAIQKADIDSFFTASGQKFTTDAGQKSFSARLIVSTTDKWGKNAEDALADQHIPVTRLGIPELDNSAVDWGRFSLRQPQDMTLKPKKLLRDHQAEALEKAQKGFESHDRGKLIMACGTGKTFTSLRIAEAVTPKYGRILFLAPSISLVSQTLREWMIESNEPMHAFVVCSDTKVGKENEDIHAYDLAYPATTDAAKLARHSKFIGQGRRTVVFSTYQSIQVVSDAQGLGLGEFDLIICDEAHRTTGITLNDGKASDFVKVHDQNAIKGKKRLYMTATPRIYGEASKTKAGNSNAVLYSMDDPALYGPEFYRLGFGKAVELDLLSEYKVLIVATDEDKMGALANRFNAYKIDSEKAIDTSYAVKIVGSWKGLAKQGLVEVDENGEQVELAEDIQPMRRAVAFSRTIKESQETTSIFSKVVEMYNSAHSGDDTTNCILKHVDGKMNALERQSSLDWLREELEDEECRILSNARCLSEGVDVPALDSVIFFDTRDSIVDIVQSVGRVMRKAPGKQYGYIILPVGIPSSKVKDYNSYIESDPQFKSVWKIIKALRAHDESLVDEAEFRKKVKVLTGDKGGSKDKDGKNGATDEGQQLPFELEFPDLPVDTIREAVYAAIPHKLGDMEYWREWAKSVANIAERLISRIRSLLERSDARSAFNSFLKGLHENLNPSISEDDAVEMLAQHIITRPVFEALFVGYSFTEKNPVSKSMQSIIEVLDDHVVSSETESLEKLYDSIRERVRLAKSDKSRQDIIRNLYDTFFNSAFPRMAERLGIVYTPIEVVDFIIRSAEVVLQKHFGSSLTDHGVQILDPFVGTGTFMVRLLQSGIIQKDDLLRKYRHELHANEIVLLAYYIAAINIESAFHGQHGGEYIPFDGIVLTDTFQMNEQRDMVDKFVLPENSQRVNRQKQQDIRVVIGNPPYSVGQTSTNDTNQNVHYPISDTRIRDTYATLSTATNKNSLYDSYIRAIRWASDRVKDKGVIAFVSNGSFIDSNVADGLRKSLVNEFSFIYCFNLRGNQRTSGETSKREGGKIFGSGSRTPVAITVMVKDPQHNGKCRVYYHDIGDYLTREEKLEKIEEFQSIDGVQWTHIQPNENGDWINQRDPIFGKFVPMGDPADGDSIFQVRSRGIESARDAWVYNFSKSSLSLNVRNMIHNYNDQVQQYGLIPQGKRPAVEQFIETDPKKIKWSSSLTQRMQRLQKLNYEQESIGVGLYRPYCKQWLYFSRYLNHRPGHIDEFFPGKGLHNLVISVVGVGSTKEFSAIMTNTYPDVQLQANGQCFPLYTYEPQDNPSKGGTASLFDVGNSHNRKDTISETILSRFRTVYHDDLISKEDIFYYVYGILHSLEYKQRFASDLSKMLPRIPFAKEFWMFSKSGRDLAKWHLSYETIDPYPVKEFSGLALDPAEHYRVKKMNFAKKGGRVDRTTIIYNENVTLTGIPLETFDYIVNGKSALEWIMERYQTTTDKDSQIANDPNAWSDDPRYILDLVKRIVRVSVETVKIVESLPPLDEIRSDVRDELVAESGSRYTGRHR